MAHHDALTGLPNRVLLRDRIGQAIAHAHRKQAARAALHRPRPLQDINDSLGHPLGDRLLQSVAEPLMICVREGDTVSRLGGDEFGVVVPPQRAADASPVAAKILERAGRNRSTFRATSCTSAPIGISLYPADGVDVETLMRNADTAMYHAKDIGPRQLPVLHAST